MAIYRNFTCTQCGEEKHECTGGRGSDVCNSCNHLNAVQARKMHLASLEGLELIERIRRIEAHLYDESVKPNPRNICY